MSARRLILAALLALALLVPATASAAPSLSASFSPNKLKTATTITLGFDVGMTPEPLTGVELHLPRGVTAGFNTLGLETCDAAQLEARGAGACPRDSLVGRGKGLVSVPVGSEQVFEPLAVTVFMAPAVKETTTMLFYIKGTDPVISQLVFHGTMVGDAAPFGTLIGTDIPPVAGLPGSPAAALVSMTVELGPKNLRYTKKEHGKTVSFHPEGFDVPASCPAGGFPFAGAFTYADGSHQSATTKTPCP
jgi:hypothetical protein